VNHLRAWMLAFGSPKVPSVPVPPPAAAPPTLANPAVSMAAANQRAMAAAAAGAGFAGTLENAGGAQGLTPPTNQLTARSLLG
jgi:hypothetical protein